MNDDDKSKEMLLAELNDLRNKISALEDENQKTENALVDGKEIYRSITNDILDSSKVGIIILDNNFRVVWINQSLAQYFGVRIEEIIGNFKENLIQNTLKHLFEEPEFYADKVLATYKDNTYIEQFECHILPDMDRDERWLELYSRPIRSGLYKGGRIEHYTDITDRKQSEVFLKVAKEYSERMINSSIDMIVSVDLDRNIIKFNKAAQKAFGYSKEEVLGKHVEILYANPSEGVETYEATLQEGNVQKEITNKRKNGETFKVFLSASVLYDENGEKTGLMGISRDISEIQKMEEELQKAQKLESIGVLAGGIAHDFNNLLTSIVGNISLVKLYLKTQGQTELLNTLKMAENASQRAQDLTQQLLTFAKGGAPIRKTISMANLLKETVGFTLRGTNSKEELSIPDDLWPIEVDEGQISQVIQNLILNADQALPEGGKIKIECENVQVKKSQGLPLEDDNYIKISVADRGIGIPQDQLQKIFDPFYTTKQKGSGLGLATAYSIVRRHNGFITVESTLGKGTTFYVYLPATAKTLPTPTPVREESPIKSKGKILVMDDEDCIIAVAGKMLKAVGYNVEFAKTGEEAIALYRKAKDTGGRFDAVILDLTIAGGMGGKEVIQLLQEEDPEVKAIVSSGYSNDPIMSSYKDYGFNGVVSKPYNLTKLSNAVHNVLVNGS